ncbi:MAG: hypothetical protein ACRDJN_14550 [Chloroflexota bacterium]
MAARSEVSVGAALEPTWRRLGHIERLGPDWDSYGAKPPAPAAVDAARRVIETVHSTFGPIAADQACPYTVAPMVDGGIQVEWRGPGGAIEVEVGPDATIGYLLERQVGTTEETGEGDDLAEPQILRLVGSVVAPTTAH